MSVVFFLNCLRICLCNSSAKSLFDISSFLVALAEVFYQKNYRLLRQVHVDIHYISDF